jgi:hypothetical protein
LSQFSIQIKYTHWKCTLGGFLRVAPNAYNNHEQGIFSFINNEGLSFYNVPLIKWYSNITSSGNPHVKNDKKSDYNRFFPDLTDIGWY